ncbi:MAG: protein translocase subunit SecD [Patescibacteria group bacterium]
MFKNNWLRLIGIIVLVGILALIDLPPAQKTFLDKVPLVGAQLADSKVSLGLDLQGGAHLDYRVITKDIPIADVPKIVAGVKEVIERRVNGLGVSEPNIFNSRIGDEEHIIVELAGIKDIEQAKAIVGKTIQLEFKEQNTEVDTKAASEIEAKAKDFLARAVAEPAKFDEIFGDFENKPAITLAKDEDTIVEGKVVEPGWKWVKDLSPDFQEAAKLDIGQVYPKLVSPGGEYFVDSTGSVKQKQGFYVVQLLAREDSAERTETTAEERQASHILISYAGAQSAAATETRSKQEAEKLAQEVLAKATAPDADFAELAKTYSDDPSAAQNSGELGFFSADKMVPEFSKKVFAAEKFGVLPEVVESPFGFHIIKYENLKAATETKTQEARVKFAKAFFSTAPDGWKATGLTGQHFRRADVGSDPTTMRPVVNIYFTQSAVATKTVNWWVLVWYLVAIAAGITLFSSLIGLLMSEGQAQNSRRDKILATLAAFALAGAIYGIVQNSASATPTESPTGPEITQDSKAAETDSAGVDLFAAITKRNLHKPIAIFLDGLPIIDTNGDGKIDENDPAYAPTVQSEILNGQAVISGLASYEEANQLAQNLNTGAIPAPVKLAGQFTVGATLGAEALATSLKAGIYGLLAVMLFVILFYRLPGFIAAIALAIYGVILIFVLQLMGVVLTLAGVAGVILSIGMAVDANILIFERLKEELALGKSLGRALEDGFDRAWTSIRDSNVSSLITCAILWGFGDSVIKGFGLTLGIGILISMFSAITVSRNFLRVLVGLIRNPKFYGLKK